MHILSADLERNGVGGERKLTTQELRIVVIQEAKRVCAWVQDSPLGPPDPVFDFRLVVDDVAELLVLWVSKGPTVLVREDMEGYDALPGLRGVRQPTFRRTTINILNIS